MEIRQLLTNFATGKDKQTRNDGIRKENTCGPGLPVTAYNGSY